MARVKETAVETASEFVESGGIVAVNGKTYAVGLVWAGVTEASKAGAAARSAAPASGADLMCVRKPGRIQYGLGAKSTGHKQGMPPLAAYLAEIVEGNFVGAFETPDGFYIAAIREDQILAGYDRLIHDRDEALETFHEVFLGSVWAQSAAPKDWGVDGTQAITLEDMLTASKPKTTLESVSRRGSILKVAGVAAIVIAAYMGWSQYSQWQQEKMLREQAAQAAAAEQAAEAEARERSAFKLPPMPWEGQQVGTPMIEACADAILKARISVAGWDPTAVTCSGDASAPQGWSVSVLLKRDGGTINWIAPAFNHAGFKPPITQNQNGDAIVTWPLDGAQAAAAYDKTSPTIKAIEARRYLTTQFEEIFQPIDLQDAAGTPVTAPTPVGSHEPTRNITLEQHLAFSLKTSHDPKDFLRILRPIPAMVARSVSLDVPSWTWTIEGTIYERLPLPADLQVRKDVAPVRR